jgi:hypothetical protein
VTSCLAMKACWLEFCVLCALYGVLLARGSSCQGLGAGGDLFRDFVVPLTESKTSDQMAMKSGSLTCPEFAIWHLASPELYAYYRLPALSLHF